MKALTLLDDQGNLNLTEVEKPTAGPDEAIVAIKAAALNHRDVWISKGMYPGIYYPCILGSDGAGHHNGNEVIINPSLNWGDNDAYQADDYKILGLPTPGTFAQYLKIPANKVLPKPQHLSMEEAAALPLAGLTAYRALFTKCALQAGEKVLISGVGGGVALFACQFAIAVGAEVYVTSSKQEKIDKAVALGAKGGANYTAEKWSKPFGKSVGGFDVIIDSAGGDGFGDLVKLCNPGARIAIYGGTRGAMKLSPQILFWKQVNIFGTSMGTDSEFAAMVQFVNEHKIKPVIDSVHPIADAAAAFAKMDAGKQFGKIVLQVD